MGAAAGRLSLLAIRNSLFASSLDSLRIELGLHAAAVALQRALGTGRVGALEDPVLPGREPAEDARLHRLRTGEAQVRLHAGEAVGGEGGALLQEDAHLIGPVDMVERSSDEAEALARLRLERFSDLGLSRLYAGGLAQ